MKRNIWVFLFVIASVMLLAACGGDDDEENDDDDLKMLDVDFDPPEEVDVDETVEFEATVTYGGDKVTDADEMEFEYWESGDRDNSTFEDGENNGDGTYTLDVSFDDEGVYEVYAHTTAEAMHHMPKRFIAVGDVSEEEVEEAVEDAEEDDDEDDEADDWLDDSETENDDAENSDEDEVNGDNNG